MNSINIQQLIISTIIAINFLIVAYVLIKYFQSKYLNDKVKERTRELRNLYDAQSRFLADISHQLQTPLSIIKGNVGIMNRKSQKSSIKSKALDVINKTVDKASNLVNDLLILARADFGQQKLSMKKLNLNYLIKELYEQSKILAEDKEIKFSFQEKDNLIIIGDKEKLKGLFLNLISNAIKYTFIKGEVKMILYKDKKQAKIEIIDTGCGIPKKDLPHIFERFYRVKRKDKSLEGKGTGLGLAISYWIVKAHDGKIIAQSKLGNGSKFIVSFLAQKK